MNYDLKKKSKWNDQHGFENIESIPMCKCTEEKKN